MSLIPNSIKSSRIAGAGIGQPGKPKIDIESDKPPKLKRRKIQIERDTALSRDFEADVEWPAHFLRLEKTFMALNTVFTFCSTRKSLGVTYEMIKDGVEKLIKRELLIEEISEIKSMLPDLVEFAYMDTRQLAIHPSNHREEERDLFEIDDREAKLTTLVFGFRDDYIRPKEHPHGQLTGRPVFSTKQLTKIINNRNSSFKAAINELLVACKMQSEDPVSLLKEAAEAHVPLQPDQLGLGGNWNSNHSKKEAMEFWAKNPHARMSIADILSGLRSADDYRGEIVDHGHQVILPKDPVYGQIDKNIDASIYAALYQARSIERLYSHQAEAVNSILRREHTVVSTPTSSGKSLVYQIPIMDALMEDENSRALWMFPTKALAQDQLKSLKEVFFGWKSHLTVSTFDGDTPKDERDTLRQHASVLMTNPDMLHITILPQEEKWRHFFRNLKYVVVDELHVYTGLFGSHVAYVMRRLRRICSALCNDRVVFISCSATITNAGKYMKDMFALNEVTVIDQDGSPAGQKERIIWNPPLIDVKNPSQGRSSTIAEASKLFRHLIDHGLKVIIFVKVRMLCEMVVRQIRTDLLDEGRQDVASKVLSYRSGYSPADRRRIEQEMFTGQLYGIVATNALELGIDIGSLDAVVTVGFPYTLAGLRQQFGRAGRRNRDSLAIFVPDPFPLDQHYAENPDKIFDAPIEELKLNIDNRIIEEGHLQCAAHEVPIDLDSDSGFFPNISEVATQRLFKDPSGYYHTHPRYLPNPSRFTSIRTTESTMYTIIDITDTRNRILEQVEESRAIFTVYEGAVYMHQGLTFIVRELCHESLIAQVEEVSVSWRTRQRDYTDIDPVEVLAAREIPDSECTAYYGTVQVKTVVFGYFKTDSKGTILDVVENNTPPFIKPSHGTWIDLPRQALQVLVSKNFSPAASIHAACHALLGLTTLAGMCSAGDIRTECKAIEKETAKQTSKRVRPARVIIYDTTSTSGGICSKAFDDVADLLKRAAAVVANCPCLDGCPSCVASSICAGMNVITSKLGARIVLEALLGTLTKELIDSIPRQAAGSGLAAGTIDLSLLNDTRSMDGVLEDLDREIELALELEEEGLL